MVGSPEGVTSSPKAVTVTSTSTGKKVGTTNISELYTDSVKVNYNSAAKNDAASLMRIDDKTRAMLSNYKKAVILVGSDEVSVITPTLRAMIPEIKALGLTPILIRNARPEDLKATLADKEVGVIVTIGHGGNLKSGEKVSVWKWGKVGDKYITYHQVSEMIKEIPGFEKKPLWFAQGCNTAVTLKGDPGDAYTHVFAEDAAINFYGTNREISGFYANKGPIPAYSPSDLKNPVHKIRGTIDTIKNLAHDVWYDNPEFYPNTANKTELDPPAKETGPLWQRIIIRWFFDW